MGKKQTEFFWLCFAFLRGNLRKKWQVFYKESNCLPARSLLFTVPCAWGFINSVYLLFPVKSAGQFLLNSDVWSLAVCRVGFFYYDFYLYVYPELLTASVGLSSCSLVADGGTGALPVSAIPEMGLLCTLYICPPHGEVKKPKIIFSVTCLLCNTSHLGHVGRDMLWKLFHA